MNILGIIASSKLGVDAGDFESIATVSVGSGGAANVEFTSIPGTYTHLQIRGISCGTRADYRIGEAEVTFNSDTGSNYACHDIYGNGSAVSATGLSSRSNIRIAPGTLGGNAGGTAFFGAIIIDILDYANVNKYKTFHYSGVPYDGSDGRAAVMTGAWMNKTSAITSISLESSSGNWTANSHFALYGIKGS